jgi:hypothetical protein
MGKHFFSFGEKLKFIWQNFTELNKISYYTRCIIHCPNPSKRPAAA